MVTVFSLFTTNGKRRSFINFVTWINRLTDVVTLSNGVTWRIQQKKRFFITRTFWGKMTSSVIWYESL